MNTPKLAQANLKTFRTTPQQPSKLLDNPVSISKIQI